MEIMEVVYDKFEQYCIDENYEKVKEYLQTFKGLANHNNGEYFEIVVDKGNLGLIKLFVENGVNVNIDNNYALYTCTFHKFDDCVKYLLSYGAKLFYQPTI